MLVDRAELEAGHEVGDDAVDLAVADRQRDRAFVVERMAEAEDAIADHFGAGADGGHLQVAGEQRHAHDRAGLELGVRLRCSCRPAIVPPACSGTMPYGSKIGEKLFDELRRESGGHQRRCEGTELRDRSHRCRARDWAACPATASGYAAFAFMPRAARLVEVSSTRLSLRFVSVAGRVGVALTALTFAA